jgi:hypothetical protein
MAKVGEEHDGKNPTGKPRVRHEHRCNVNANESDVGQKNAGEARIDNDSSSRDATCITAKPTSAKGTPASGTRPSRRRISLQRTYRRVIREVVLRGVNAAEQQRLANVLNCKLGKFPISYIGLPVRGKQLRVSD